MLSLPNARIGGNAPAGPLTKRDVVEMVVLGVVTVKDRGRWRRRRATDGGLGLTLIEDGIVIAAVSGEIDMSNAARLVATVTAAVANEATGLIMDSPTLPSWTVRGSGCSWSSRSGSDGAIRSCAW
jgi:hypothetical protein